MKTTPVWSIPLLLVLAGIVLFVGALPAILNGFVLFQTVVVCGYLIWRSRRTGETPKPVANVLPLFPAHLLLLLAIARLPDPAFLGILWTLVPAVSLAYDAVTAKEPWGPRFRASILAGLYAILWADLFFLWERVIVLARGISGTEAILVAAAFGVAGTGFLSLGIYRHWRASKE